MEHRTNFAYDTESAKINERLTEHSKIFENRKRLYIECGQECLGTGEYRWAAELLSNSIKADHEDMEAAH